MGDLTLGPVETREGPGNDHSRAHGDQRGLASGQEGVANWGVRTIMHGGCKSKGSG